MWLVSNLSKQLSRERKMVQWLVVITRNQIRLPWKGEYTTCKRPTLIEKNIMLRFRITWI
jgi:hypothetical protein